MSNTIQTQIYSVGQTFGIPGAENIQMTSHAPCGNPYVPQTNANYKFRKDLLRNLQVVKRSLKAQKRSRHFS